MVDEIHQTLVCKVHFHGEVILRVYAVFEVLDLSLQF